MSTKSLPALKIDWTEVFDKFEGDDDTLAKAKAASLLACGMSVAQVSSDTGIDGPTIRRWMTLDRFNSALKIIKDNLADFLNSGLSRKYMRASERLDWILSVDPLAPDIPEKMRIKILEEQQKAARLLYETGVIPKEVPTETHQAVTVAVLNMTDSAAKVLLDRMPEIKEIDGEA